MKRQYIIFTLVLVVLISCKKDEETEQETRDQHYCHYHCYDYQTNYCYNLGFQ